MFSIVSIFGLISFKLGASDYVSKPFNHEELITRVSHHIYLAAAQRTIMRQRDELQATVALSGLIKDKTVLIIAHRMRTVMNADQIVLLSGGRVVEMGSPAELLKKNGLFRHMAQLQSESMEWTA